MEVIKDLIQFHYYGLALGMLGSFYARTEEPIKPAVHYLRGMV